MGIGLTGNDIIEVGGRNMIDLANGDVAMLDIPNNLVEATTGKNGNTIYALNSTGRQSTLTMRVLAGSDDDKYMNSQIALYSQDPPSYPLLTGNFVKRVGNGEGAVTEVIYKLAGGVVQKLPAMKENVEGDTESAVTEYVIVYANSERNIS